MEINLNLPFDVQSIGYFRDGLILFPKGKGNYDKINWHKEGAYIREDGIESFTLVNDGCNYKEYLVKKPLAFIFYQTSYKYDLNNLTDYLIGEISKLGYILSISKDKELIMKDEKMNENLNEFIKIKFYVEYRTSGNCGELICNC